jgi:predicted signal transduction protein with EAL and GGDEF domain
VHVATRLKEAAPAEATVWRLGGDEFALLVSESDRKSALKLADKVLHSFKEPFGLAGHSLSLTGSIGIALFPTDGSDFPELLKNADTALNRAKQGGRNTRIAYDPMMNDATFGRLLLEAELRKAIVSDQLRIHFQPKVSMPDRALVGAEALVRWEHPVRGLLSPGQFVPVAESSDLILELGDWIISDVCRQLAAWHSAGLPQVTVAINLAARHFRRPALSEHINSLLQAYGLSPEVLELELTESTLVDRGPSTLANLRDLQKLGVRVSLDDFGTGYSCLSYLKQLPLSALKIDQSFIKDLATDSGYRRLAGTVIELGHMLGLDVVAEGVETEEQCRILVEEGCELGQGYLFGHPVPAKEFAARWLPCRTDAR